MARVVLVGNLTQLTDGVAEFDLPASSVKELFRLLAERHPALSRHLDEGIAVAIDGQIYQDTLLEPIAPDSEVYLIPQIAGGLLGVDKGSSASLSPSAGRSTYGQYASRPAFGRRLAADSFSAPRNARRLAADSFSPPRGVSCHVVRSPNPNVCLSLRATAIR